MKDLALWLRITIRRCAKTILFRSTKISFIHHIYYRMIEEQIRSMKPKELVRFIFHIGFVANGMSPFESTRLLDKIEKKVRE